MSHDNMHVYRPSSTRMLLREQSLRTWNAWTAVLLLAAEREAAAQWLDERSIHAYFDEAADCYAYARDCIRDAQHHAR